MTETATVPAVADGKAPIAYGNRGLQMQSFDDLHRFAKALVMSKLAPKGDEVSDIIIKVQMGGEVGLPPMAAIQNIAVINGRPSIWGDAMLAVCQQSPAFDHSRFREYFEGKGEDAVAICECARKGGQLRTQRFGVKQAKHAKLWGKQGPWTDYPQRMLQLRARSWALRDTFPSELRGLIAREEAWDIPTGDYSVSVDGDEPPALEMPMPDPDALKSAANIAPKEEKPPAKKGGKSKSRQADAKDVAQADPKWQDLHDELLADGWGETELGRKLGKLASDLGHDSFDDLDDGRKVGILTAVKEGA